MRTLLNPAHKSQTALDVALLVARVALGVILLAHGLQKLNEYTLAGTAASFADMGVPAPALAAWFVTAVEILGGGALILGLLTPVAGILNIVSLLGAIILVHAENGVFVQNNGFELVLALFAGLVVIVLLGAGKFSIDGIIGRKVAAQ